MAMKLYIGGLAYSTTDKELEEFFATQGKVVSASVVKDKISGQSRGFGFVEMEDLKEGQNAIKELNGKQLGGREIMVNQARDRQEGRPTGGGSRPRGGSGGGFRRTY